MMKRLFTLIVGIILVCTTCWANQEYDIMLERGDESPREENLGYGNISFTLSQTGNAVKVLVSLRNIMSNEAILIFKRDHDEKTLKNMSPKIEFDNKKFQGEKGRRKVECFSHLSQETMVIMPAEQKDLLEMTLFATSDTVVSIPIYIASFDNKKFRKKGADGTSYKIIRSEIDEFKIFIKGWSENDPDYVSTKNAVEDYIRSVNVAAFCKNRKHTPNLAQQQKPYQERKDSLINVINTTLQNHSEWFSTDKPHVKYSELLSQLNKVNLKEHEYDCGDHKVTPKQHSCNYCSLSAQQIYHQLDDLYQQLRNGKITKDVAVKKAQGLNTCYQKSSKRKKDASYSDKISKFYSRITNY